MKATAPLILITILGLTSIHYSVGAESRIIGGTKAESHTFPYQVAIFSEGDHCSGSLISKRFVLTAAHCLKGYLSALVKLGVHNVTDNSSCLVEQKIAESDFIVHASYDNPYNDIALIKLNEPVEFNDCIKSINLPRSIDKEKRYVGENATASGWGLTDDLSTPADDLLRYVNVSVIDDRECNERYPGVIKPNQLCTSGVGVKGICRGDSGGPLTFQEADGSKTLIGVASQVHFLCEAQEPSVFVRVTSYLDWIAENSDVKIRP